MCGIVAYIGPREAYPIILKGLKRLEYRGYDSAGIALLNSGLKVHKKRHYREKIFMHILVLAIRGGPHMVSPMTAMHIRIFLPAAILP
jgi:glutamine phosphoribosylpyrophosphate amidotransferase